MSPAANAVALLSASGAELRPNETSLSSAVCLRHTLIGLAIGIVALLLAVALGIWLVAAIFHTAPGALA